MPSDLERYYSLAYARADMVTAFDAGDDEAWGRLERLEASQADVKPLLAIVREFRLILGTHATCEESSPYPTCHIAQARKAATDIAREAMGEKDA